MPQKDLVNEARKSNRRATVQTHLEEKQDSRRQDLVQSAQQPRPLPAWMSLLPSNVNPHVKPPGHSVLRRMSFPSYSSSSNPTPYMTPLEWPISHDDYASNHLQTPPQLSLDGDITPMASEKQKRHSSTDLANALVHAADLFSTPSSTPPTAIPTQPSNDVTLVQSPAINYPTARDIIAIPDHRSSKPAYSTPFRRTYGSNTRATSSETQISSFDRPPSSKKYPTPPAPARPSFPSTNLRLATYGLNPCVSSSETCIPSLSSATTVRAKDFNPVTINKPYPQQKPSNHDPQTTPPQIRATGTSQITPNPPPFLKELSTFFASRTAGMYAKLILPSRAVESTGRGADSPKIGLRGVGNGDSCGDWGGSLICGGWDGGRGGKVAYASGIGDLKSRWREGGGSCSSSAKG